MCGVDQLEALASETALIQSLSRAASLVQDAGNDKKQVLIDTLRSQTYVAFFMCQFLLLLL
jgi:hydroxymethylglutaryl-CoA reductase